VQRFRALTCVAAVALAGCGSNPSSAQNFEGDEKAVAQIVEDLSAAARAGDPEEICSRLLSTALVERMKAGERTCAEEVDDSLGDADDHELEVQDVTVSGTTATARVEGRAGSGNKVATFRFVKEDGRWKAEAIS
jgi:hypothetical protein